MSKSTPPEVEIRARELLAAEEERAGYTRSAMLLRSRLPLELGHERSIRAIIAAISLSRGDTARNAVLEEAAKVADNAAQAARQEGLKYNPICVGASEYRSRAEEADAIATAIRALAALTPQDDVVETLREALKPFALAAEAWPAHIADHHCVQTGPYPVLLGDLRKARACLEAIRVGGGM